MAPAKVNLVLSVGARQADGYHEVRTVLQAISLWDSIHITARNTLTVCCSDPRIEDGPTNLAWRAAEALRRAARLDSGACIRVRKGIPAEAGLGGGSSDAARSLLSLVETRRSVHGGYLTGLSLPSGNSFPSDEYSSYSAAAVILADHVISTGVRGSLIDALVGGYDG